MSSDVKSIYVQTPGLRFHALASGLQGKKQPVLLVHGFPQTSHEWRHQIPVLAAAGHPVYAVDTRGYGRTDKPRIRITRAMLADDVLAFCDALNLQDVALIGHDWGGMIGFKVAIDNPARIRKLALIDTLCTVTAPEIPHPYFYKIEPLAEAFFADHARDLIEVRIGGAAGKVMGGLPGNPYPVSAEARGRPAWVSAEDVEHYASSFDADSQFAAIQYYRYAMPFHRVIPDASAAGGERYQAMSEAEIAAMWLFPGGRDKHPLAGEYFDFGPEDRHKRYPNPALYVYGKQFAARYPKAADGVPPSGNPLADQYARYFPDLTVRAADCGHYVPEEQPAFLNEVLLKFLGD
jgi:pimeloyl-ACP methyl ester carboxylesterase